MAEVDRYLPPRKGPSDRGEVFWRPAWPTRAIREQATARVAGWSGLEHLAALGFRCSVVQPGESDAIARSVGVRFVPPLQMGIVKPMLGSRLTDWAVGKLEEPPVVADHLAEDVVADMETLGLTFRDVARIYGRGIPCEQPAQVGDHAEALVVQAELARQRADVPAPQAVAA